ncbi:MAG: hypothetical protein KDJ65_01945 [Anaerolineae bacterium]|nr:hypothetical protein [Anaerolineae bacterium]
MNSLPPEFEALNPQIEGMPAEVVQAFRYSLARLLVEAGRLSDVSSGGNTASSGLLAVLNLNCRTPTCRQHRPK